MTKLKARTLMGYGDKKTCQGCKIFHTNASDLSQGDCCVNPPTAVPVPDGRGGLGIFSFSPVVNGGRTACEKYLPKLENGRN
jgi:hypothetical protein